MTLFENAYNEVTELVRKFDEHKDQFIAHNYQEAHARTEFIDKFWTALGWDVRHDFQTNPREQEVKIEKSDTAGSTRRVYYAFRLKPDYKNTVFFCEAKKPSVDLANVDDYFQLVRYGYGAGTPVGVLTNFDEFHIIDCRYQPHIEKSYPSAQIKVFGYKDYLDREAFGFIYWLFSREAIATGKLKDYASGLPKQRGSGKTKLTAEEAKPVDEAFLIKLEEYRRILAKAFKKADESLTAEVLTEATQKVIDRLVFIRFLEDKYIEADYIVDQIAANRTGTGNRGPGSGSGTSSSTAPGPRNPAPVRSAWKSFLAWSKELDVKYNGVVFKPHDIDKPTFAPPDDKVFAELCTDISHSHSKYLFTYIPIELLGSIYERFLGKVVTTTAKRAEIEEKPEVRKAGGVYYTPKYIVDYIVANTVGKILNSGSPSSSRRRGLGGGAVGVEASVGAEEETPPPAPSSERGGGLTPKEISKLRFADIACGSGSFLIAVYDTVLHHVEKYYNDNPDEAKKAKCTEIEKGIYVLSLKQKQQILLDNIFGVDIDRQAVEVAQLSLFLKLLESESGATAEQLSFERTKILPDLSKNIQCGNSLVEYDISDLFPLTDEEEKRIKPFSFQSAFREIMANGGFDAIVGNPPYVYGRDWKQLGIGEEQKRYFIQKYVASSYQLDMFSLFMERCSQLCKIAGYVGEIVPNVWLTNTYSSTTRKYLLSRVCNLVLASPPKNVFHGITVDTVVYSYQNQSCEHGEIQAYSIDESGTKKLGVFGDEEYRDGSKPIALRSDSKIVKVLEKIKAEKGILGDVAELTRGVHPYRVGGYGKTAFGSGVQTAKDVETRPYNSSVSKKGYRPFIYGKDLKRFTLPIVTDYINYGSHLAEPRQPEFFEGSRIYSRKILSERLMLTVVDDDSVADQQVYITKPRNPIDTRPLAAIMGSRMMAFFIKRFYDETDEAFPQIKVSQLRALPVINLSEPSFAKIKETLGSLINQVMQTNQRLVSANRDSEREQYKLKCDYLETEIDRLVYELYGLTVEERKIVEGAG